MMTRSTTSAVTGRASAMRRMRRRSQSATAVETRMFCRTNGCASFLEVDATTGQATCPVCGYTPRTH